MKLKPCILDEYTKEVGLGSEVGLCRLNQVDP
jgi:hypothetical protein